AGLRPFSHAAREHLVFAGQPGRAYGLDEKGGTFVLADVDDPGARFQPAGRFVADEPDFARQIVADPRTPGRLLALSRRPIRLSTDGNAALWNGISRASDGPTECPLPASHRIEDRLSRDGIKMSSPRNG
ncbi:MAG: hypothetical protein LC780_14730, partial [Acidobacteria bacterium]|nr:hypothetical protein [Acidobacteriota bacterium]